jgi:hypothetical protein
MSMSATVRLLALLIMSSIASGCGGDGMTDAPDSGHPSGAAGAAGGSTGGAGAGGGGAIGAAGASGANGTGGRGGASATAGNAGTGAAGGIAGGTGGAPGAGGTTGGTEGAAGRGGTGGTTAAAGRGGAGGTGPGGAAGTGGNAGTAGRGGAAGKAGGGAGGQGGSAGAGGNGGALASTTIWIAGDSTVMTYAAANTDGNNGVSIEGWGQEIGQFFTSQVTINNQAIGGRSVAFFMWSVVKDSAGSYQCVDDQGNPQYQLDAAGNRIDTSQWARIKSGIKAGDFLLIQFGTNDETHTCPRYVSLPDFETDFGMIADTARAKGATPIFVTPMGHRSFSGSTVTNTLLPYANAMKDEAAKKTVEIEDLNLRSEEYYMSVGSSYLATNIFDGGTTHFIKAGAVKMAELIAGEVRKNKGPLAAYLK